MVVDDVIKPARLRLVDCLGSERIRLPPTKRGDVVTVEGSTVTIDCRLLGVTITDEVSDTMDNVGSGLLTLRAVEVTAVRAVGLIILAVDSCLLSLITLRISFVIAVLL